MSRVRSLAAPLCLPRAFDTRLRADMVMRPGHWNSLPFFSALSCFTINTP